MLFLLPPFSPINFFRERQQLKFWFKETGPTTFKPFFVMNTMFPKNTSQLNWARACTLRRALAQSGRAARVTVRMRVRRWSRAAAAAGAAGRKRERRKLGI